MTIAQKPYWTTGQPPVEFWSRLLTIFHRRKEMKLTDDLFTPFSACFIHLEVNISSNSKRNLDLCICRWNVYFNFNQRIWWICSFILWMLPKNIQLPLTKLCVNLIWPSTAVATTSWNYSCESMPRVLSDYCIAQKLLLEQLQYTLTVIPTCKSHSHTALYETCMYSRQSEEPECVIQCSWPALNLSIPNLLCGCYKLGLTPQ